MNRILYALQSTDMGFSLSSIEDFTDTIEFASTKREDVEEYVERSDYTLGVTAYGIDRWKYEIVEIPFTDYE